MGILSQCLRMQPIQFRIKFNNKFVCQGEFKIVSKQHTDIEKNRSKEFDVFTNTSNRNIN